MEEVARKAAWGRRVYQTVEGMDTLAVAEAPELGEDAVKAAPSAPGSRDWSPGACRSPLRTAPP